MKMNEFIKKVCQVLEQNYFKKDENTDYFSYEIYVDYRDKGLSPEKISELLECDNPKEAFEDYLSELACDYEFQYGYDEMCKLIKDNLTIEELIFWDENEDEVNNWLQEHVSWYYDENDFRTDVKVNIMLDTGDGNYDFTKNNILNWYASNGYGENDGGISELSPVLWLAKQQEKEQEVLFACKEVYMDGCYDNIKDKFTESIVQELENIASHMSTLTFLVKMDLFQLFELHHAMKIEKPFIKEFYPQDSETKGTITISKDTTCGLFNPWDGCGSVLHIELCKDVVLPIKYIWQARVEKRGDSWNYGINDVYDLVDSAWDGKVKEIIPMIMEE